MARKGASGHGLHGSTSRVFDSQYYYHHSNGQIRTCANPPPRHISRPVKVAQTSAAAQPGACFAASTSSGTSARASAAWPSSPAATKRPHSTPCPFPPTCFRLKMGFAIRNFFVPEDIALHSADQDCVVAVEAKAGDMVIFLCAPTILLSLPF